MRCYFLFGYVLKAKKCDFKESRLNLNIVLSCFNLLSDLVGGLSVVIFWFISELTSSWCSWLVVPNPILGFSCPTGTKLANFSQRFSLVRGAFNFQDIKVTANPLPRINPGQTFEDIREFRRSTSTPLHSATAVCKQYYSDWRSLFNLQIALFEMRFQCQ